MDTSTSEWWRRHGWTVALLLVAFGIAFGVRTIWQYPVISQYGALYTYAGGSDSYYHSRVMTYIIQNHRNLVWDPMLRFPVGAVNPREPLFDWMNAILGIVFAPLFGGNVVNAGAWFLSFDSPFWAALTVFPLYLIGREASGRRTGLVAALVYPFFSASIDSSTFGYADYLSFYTFFLLIVLYAYLRTLKAIGHRRWVESYRHPRQYLPGVLGFLRSERTAVKWSVFTGVALGAFALSWQGYTYAIVVVVFTVLIAMLIERIRRIDSFGLYVSAWIIGLIAFSMAAPYYLVQGEIRAFLELPIILFFGTLLLLLPFLMLRDVPWVFSIPSLLALVALGVLGMKFLSPALFNLAVSGNGYFVKNLVYSTVAEAQAPSIDALIVAYGVMTFFLAFAGLALFGYHLAHQRFKRYHIAFLIFAIVSIYLPISAAKFFLVASPAFALLSGEAIHRLLDVGGYPQLRRAVASLTDRTGSLSAFRKSFKARHVLVLALAVGILLPNIWISIDAGIPSNTKASFEVQIEKTIPSWLKLNGSAPPSSYLGAAGTGLDTSNQYDSAGYSWLAQQDTNVPEPQRPALVAWWDYGFQTIDQGMHPSVADNFQNGIDPAGQFLLSQNESLAIAVLATTLLQGEILGTHVKTLPTALNEVLARDGVNVTGLHAVLDDEAADWSTVIHNPQTYLPVDPSTITYDNTMYLATSYYLASHLSLAGMARVYDDLEAYTGWSIRYALTDSRTFPFSGTDTGIFYAPADLTGRVISGEGIPTTFFNVTILGSDGTLYPLGPLPAGVSAAQYNINYSAPFFDTMLYRIYIGYNGTQVGQSGGIPGLSGAAQGDAIEPGWMLQHFEVDYRTAYVCPGVKNASAGAGCMLATNRPSAVAIANRTKGSDDLSALSYFEGGESILEYYPGVTLDGRVALPGGQPDPGVRVTVYDGWGIPHMTDVTDANGSFSLVLPPGNDTLNITYGAFDASKQADANLITSIPMPISDALGFDTAGPSMVESFTAPSASVDGQVYWNVAGNKSYVPVTDPVAAGARVVLNGQNRGASLSATTDASGTFSLVGVPPGTYNVSVRSGGAAYAALPANVSAGRTLNLSVGLPPGSVSGVVLGPDLAPYVNATVTLTSAAGGIFTALTNGTGAYEFSGAAPGGYGIVAVGSTPGLESRRVAFALPGFGSVQKENLTLESTGSVVVAASACGSALINASVSFTPLVSFSSRSIPGVAAALSAATNSTFATTGAQGVVRALLGLGNYSVLVTARVGGRVYDALGLVNVSGPGATESLSLTLAPAQATAVTVPQTSVSSTIKTAIVAYGPGGTEAFAWPGGNGSALLFLPDGTYGLLALRGALAAGSSLSAGLGSVTVEGPTSATVPVGRVIVPNFAVGTPAPDGSVLKAPNATVVVSEGPSGPAVRVVGEPNGTVGFQLPASVPTASGGYCVSASAFGFAPRTTCGLSPGALANLTTFDLEVNPVPVALRVEGLPSGTSVTVNFTGKTIGAQSLSLTGGPTFSLTLVPGTYGVGARAVIGDGTVVYLPSSVLSTIIPLGATFSNLTLIVVPEINASGKLSVPSGVTLASVKVALASPLLNVTVNGSAFTKAFRATPTTYTATVSAVHNGVPYVEVGRVTLYANGTILPRLVLSAPGISAAFSLTRPNGTTLDVAVPVTLVTSTGLVIVEQASGGQVSAELPPGTYRVYANATVATPGPNGTFYANWTTGLSASCTVSSSARNCSVPVTSTPVVVGVHGLLLPVGATAPVAGSLELIGPYPSTNVTKLSTSNGMFSAALLPGAYAAYGVSTSSPYLAGFGHLLALPAPQPAFVLPLGSTWTAAVQVTAASGTTLTAFNVNVSVQDPLGDVATFGGVAVGSTVDLALPTGTYAVSASAPGVRGGVDATAVGSVTVELLDGNAAVTLRLGVPVRATATGTIAGASTVSVAAGGKATFAFSVTANGNVPVTVHPVGSPSTWGFGFSFANVTLDPGASLSASVLVSVPPGTVVNHPPVAITFELSNGTVAGNVTPAPTVNVAGYYGLSAGTSTEFLPSVGSASAVLPFYAVNTGNLIESVDLALVDAGRLADYGWTPTFLQENQTLSLRTVFLSPQENLSLAVQLNASSSSAVPPGSVTVQLSVEGGSGALTSSVLLKVPRPAVRTSSGSFFVTGPSVQGGPSPVPVWFVPLVAFLPAIALVVGVVTYRWWRTRRWTRR
jgi:dolichyl-phosphooligosaccharide-protein glycotransferase